METTCVNPGTAPAWNSTQDASLGSCHCSPAQSFLPDSPIEVCGASRPGEEDSDGEEGLGQGGACVTSWVSCLPGSLLPTPQRTVLGSLVPGKLKGIPSNFAVSRESPTQWTPKGHFSLSAQPPRPT